MPTGRQVERKFELMYGKPLFTETINIRGSAYVGNTKSWVTTQKEFEKVRDSSDMKYLEKRDRFVDDDIYD